jgi:hypothetical protein
MKLKINTSEGLKLFFYNGILEGNIYFTVDKADIMKNIKIFDIINDTTEKARYTKIDNFVIITISGGDDINSKSQILITENSIFDECPKEFQELLKFGFELNKKLTLNDLNNLLGNK